MEHITIRKDANLKIILDFIEKDSETFIYNTLNYLEINEWVADASDEWGKTIGELLDESKVDSYGPAILALRTNQPTVIKAFRNLVIVGHGDCPKCGGDMDERLYEPDPTKGTDDYVCIACGYETKPEYHDESYEDQ